MNKDSIFVVVVVVVFSIKKGFILVLKNYFFSFSVLQEIRLCSSFRVVRRCELYRACQRSAQV